MKLRFDVDQAAAFRAGYDAPQSWCMIEVNPGELTPPIRALIANRLRGIDVFPLVGPEGPGYQSKSPTRRIVADFPTLDGLIGAIRKDESAFLSQIKQKTN